LPFLIQSAKTSYCAEERIPVLSLLIRAETPLASTMILHFMLPSEVLTPSLVIPLKLALTQISAPFFFACSATCLSKSLEILEQYSNRITILSQANQGLAAALNAAIKKIDGLWFKWLSPDDILYPNAIEILLQEAKKLPKNTIVYSNWELIDEKASLLGNFFESNYNNLEKFEFNVRLLDGQQINVNTTLIPTSLFKSGCLIQNLEDPVAIDYDFFLRAGIVYDASFHLIPNTLLKYRIHTKQLSHKNISKSLSYISLIRNQILSTLANSKKDQYLTSLQEYKKKKPLTKKTMELGLQVVSNTLPSWLSDRLIVLYLNKFRRTR